MRALILITAILISIPATVNAKKKRSIAVEESALFGIKVEQMTTGTGHGSGYTFNAQVNKGRKGLEVGFIYNTKNEKLSGGDFRYKVFLGSPYRVNSVNKAYKPYLQYNVVYQKGLSTGNEIINLEGINYEMQQEPGMVATFGHFLGYGNKIQLFNNAYLDSSLGFGIYQGSIDKINGPDTFGYHNNNIGLTYSFKIGFGYTFN